MQTQSHRTNFNLEERTFNFARRTRIFLSSISSGRVMVEDKKQLVRSSGSVAANYLEANEGLSRKDFVMRVKICRKEAKESHMWLKLIRESVEPVLHVECDSLIDESLQLVKIFNTIAYKVNLTESSTV
jgi:four helix bundle protein